MSQNVIYTDNNATTMVAPEVVEAMTPFFSQLYGNASSMHFFGGQIKKYVEDARAKAHEKLTNEALGKALAR